MLEKCLKEHRGLLFETVLSIPEKVDFIWRSKQAGFFIRFVYVATNNPEINMLRIAWRVDQGGHTVPQDKIKARYERSLKLALKAALIVDRAYFIDNTKEITEDSSFEPQPLFRMVHGAISKTYLSEDKFPDWIQAIYSQARIRHFEKLIIK
jgi:predicted ABC-type ATPase